jgi:hypothetical protein
MLRFDEEQSLSVASARLLRGRVDIHLSSFAMLSNSMTKSVYLYVLYKPNDKGRGNYEVSQKYDLYFMLEECICIVMYFELVQLGVVSLCAVPDASVQGYCTLYMLYPNAGVDVERSIHIRGTRWKSHEVISWICMLGLKMVS